MNKQTITIGIPAFNEAKNIGNLILTIHNQTPGNYEVVEIIVISDHSTDSTYGTVRDIKDPKIKIVENSTRLGQNLTQNKIVDMMSDRSEHLLLLEADTILDKDYISALITEIQDVADYSIAYGINEAIPPSSIIGKFAHAGFKFRTELFNKANDKINLYNFSGGGLYSKKFLRNFRWSPQFHDDSYAFRSAINSPYPLIKSGKAISYLKLVENAHDFFLQSIKYQKASHVERPYSTIYTLNIEPKTFIKIFLKHLWANPTSFLGYMLLTSLSRVLVFFAPAYTPFWKSYLSTKVLDQAAPGNYQNTIHNGPHK